MEQYGAVGKSALVSALVFLKGGKFWRKELLNQVRMRKIS